MIFDPVCLEFMRLQIFQKKKNLKIFLFWHYQDFWLHSFSIHAFNFPSIFAKALKAQKTTDPRATLEAFFNVYRRGGVFRKRFLQYSNL